MFLCAAIVLAALALIVFAGCGKDAEVEKRDSAPAAVIQFPKGFANVAHKCDGNGHRVYSAGGTDAGVAVAVVDDASCARR